MRQVFNFVLSYRFPQCSLPLALLMLCILTYGLMIPGLGFYWDDFPLVWISQKLGPEGLQRYFSTNRPFWGLLYQITTPILGAHPWLWQVFAMVWYWLSAALLWGMLRLLWPRHPQAATWASLLFAVYPGFGQRFISLVYSHLFIVLTAFLGSLLMTLRALRRPASARLSTVLSLGLSLVNLLSMEYFFLLELLRPVLVWIVQREEGRAWKSRLRRTALLCLPYLMLFFGISIWRTFFFRYQTQNYRPELLTQVAQHLWQALIHLSGMVVKTIWVVTGSAYSKVFSIPDLAALNQGATQVSLTLTIFIIILIIGYLLRLSSDAEPPAPEQGQGRAARQNWAIQAIGLGLLALALGGTTYWVIDRMPALIFPLDRFTLSFMPGVALLLAGLLGLIPFPDRIKNLVLAILVGLSAGVHIRDANVYRRDWNTQKAFFWQMSWRIPALQPGTTLLVNDLPLTYYSDNSLTAPLNWIYAPNNHSERMNYILYYPSQRLGKSLPSLGRGVPLKKDYLAATFHGSTDQVVAIYFAPPACLRVLDAKLDNNNAGLPDLMRQAAALSRTAPILPEGFIELPGGLYGPEPVHSWCYYFEKADLARQQMDWTQVADLGDQALVLDDDPKNPLERAVFIEGYAHVERWEDAIQQTQLASGGTQQSIKQVLCQLWERIEAETPSSRSRETALKRVRTNLACVLK